MSLLVSCLKFVFVFHISNEIVLIEIKCKHNKVDDDETKGNKLLKLMEE